MVILSLQKQKLDLLLIQVGMVAQGLPNAIQELLPKMKKFYQKESVSLDLVLNSELVGSSGSNEIDAIDIIFDREFIQPGESKLKIEVKPGNGLSYTRSRVNNLFGHSC